MTTTTNNNNRKESYSVVKVIDISLLILSPKSLAHHMCVHFELNMTSERSL